MRFFLDTYAMIEIVRGNEKYRSYLNYQLFTSILHMYELYYDMIKTYPSEIVQQYYSRFLGFVIPIKSEHVFAASVFKLAHVKNGVSYADAIGYTMALHEGMKFLTGDKEFKDIENVEFVK